MSSADAALLAAPMEGAAWPGGHIAVVPLAEEHREGFRACCDPADPVWEVYPYNLLGANFDPLFDAALGLPGRMAFAVMVDGKVRGTTSFLAITPDRQGLEIGGTFLAQGVRGIGLNARVKDLLLTRVFAAGFRRVEFRVDARNARSQAAVLKLGAVREGLLRAERITWTGHVRDTVVFSILTHEWQEAKA
ncbi:MAG: GNAT family protein [Alteraurantiacibacter sp.]